MDSGLGLQPAMPTALRRRQRPPARLPCAGPWVLVCGWPHIEVLPRTHDGPTGVLWMLRDHYAPFSSTKHFTSADSTSVAPICDTLLWAPYDPQNSCGAVLCVRNRVYGGYTQNPESPAGIPREAPAVWNLLGSSAEPQARLHFATPCDRPHSGPASRSNNPVPLPGGRSAKLRRRCLLVAERPEGGLPQAVGVHPGDPESAGHLAGSEVRHVPQEQEVALTSLEAFGHPAPQLLPLVQPSQEGVAERAPAGVVTPGGHDDDRGGLRVEDVPVALQRVGDSLWRGKQ